MKARIKNKKDKWMKSVDNLGGNKYKGSHKRTKEFNREFKSLIGK